MHGAGAVTHVPAESLPETGVLSATVSVPSAVENVDPSLWYHVAVISIKVYARACALACGVSVVVSVRFVW
jgi:hypothetical protein